jgi:RNA polymerase sigma-70 factor, ECF subfamily
MTKTRAHRLPVRGRGPSFGTVDTERVFLDHHDDLLRYLLWYTGDADQAADVAQETFLRLLSRPPAGDVRPWLFKVAMNVVRDDWRRQRDLQPLDVDHPSSDDPVAELEGAERRRWVRRALQHLSARLRGVLLMREQGFTHMEIGKILGISPNSVGPLAARALVRLERALRQESADEL